MSALIILAESNQGISTQQTPDLVYKEIINLGQIT